MDLNALMCCICEEMLNEPKDLPCHHSCCRVCLQNYCLHNATVNGFPCPQCKVMTKVADPNRPLVEWIEFFKTNYETLRKLENLNLSKSKKEVKCVLCLMKWNAVRATKYCKACDENFCDECGNQHWLLRASRAHRVMLLEELEEKKKDPLLKARLLAIFNAKERQAKLSGNKTRSPRATTPVPESDKSCNHDDCHITGATFLKDGRVVLLDERNNKLKLFDRNYQILHSVATSGWDILGISECNFVVTCPNERLVKHFSCGHYDIEEEHQVETSGECYGLCLVDGKVGVACSGSPVSLQIFERNAVKSISLEKGKYKLTTPSYLAYNSKSQTFIISDNTNKCVKCCDMDGKITWERQIPDVQGVAVYENHVLIARAKQRTVDIVNKEGQSLKSVVSVDDGLLHSRVVSVQTDHDDDAEDRLLVTDDTELVRVFALEDPLKEDEGLRTYFSRGRTESDSETTDQRKAAGKTRFCSLV